MSADASAAVAVELTGREGAADRFVARAGGRAVGSMLVERVTRGVRIRELRVDATGAAATEVWRALVDALTDHELVGVEVPAADRATVERYLALGFRRVGGRATVELERWGRSFAASFDEDVAGYERSRPGYPAELFDLLAERCAVGRPGGTRVVEIGAGSGQATLPLLDLGATVTAIEPGPNMAARLRERTRGRPCTVVVAPLEDVALDEEFDVACSATAFHWVSPADGVARVARLVGPGGWFAVWWNVYGRPDDRPDALSGALRPIVDRYQGATSLATPYPFDERQRRLELSSGGWFDVVAAERLAWEHRHDAASLRGLFASFSAWSTLPEPTRTQALDEIAAVVDERFGGAVTRTYTTQLYLARRTSVPA